MFILTRKQKAHVIIHNAAAAAGGIGAGWLSDLVLIPDVLPLSALQAVMVLLLTRLFRIQPVKGMLIGLTVAFCTGVLGRGFANLVFLRFPEQQTLIDVIVAVGLTEALGWTIYQALLALRPPNTRTPHSLMIQAIVATQHGPLRVLLTSAPMLVALLAALVVLDVEYLVEVRLRAPNGTAPLMIEHPLVELNQGLLRVSGVPRGAAEKARVELVVKNDPLAAQLQRQVLYPAMTRVSVLAYVPPGESGTLIVDSSWQTQVETLSDYWPQVRSRLSLLLLGLLGTVAMIWLGEHRSRQLRPLRR